MGLIGLVLLSVIVFVKSDYGATYYVSTNGNDSNNGSINAPFKSLTKARDVIRSYSSLPNGGIIVYIRGGTYTAPNLETSGETLLDLQSIKDSGNAMSPIVWTCYPNEKCVISGGISIPSNAFKESNKYPSLLVANLTDIDSGWNNINLGKLTPNTLGQCNNGRSELFVNNQRMTLARWPNTYNIKKYGKLKIYNWTQIIKVINSDSFEYDASYIGKERIQTWLDEVNSANGDSNSPWLHGYWMYDWADSYVQIKSIDMDKSVITSYDNTPPVYGYKAKARYYGVNILSELDMMDEYYIDTINKLVYISKLRQNTLNDDMYVISTINYVINVGNIPSVVEQYGRRDYWNSQKYLDSFVSPPGSSKLPYTYKPISTPKTADNAVEYVTIANLTITSGINSAIVANSVNYCTFSGLEVTGFGEIGIRVSGYNNTIRYNTITDVGCSLLSVEGGDLNSLTKGNNIVEYNDLSLNANWRRTYNPQIGFGGVGNVYNNNTLNFGPHTGITGSCTECIFSNNYVNQMVFEASDAGAWYSGRSWIHRHNLIINNTFINIYNITEIVLGSLYQQGVYFDDQLSDGNVTLNKFINSTRGVLLGGGRRVYINNNYFSSCELSVEFDDRGLTWQTSYCQPNGTFNAQLISVNYTNPPWSTVFPYLPNVFNDDPCTPVYNNITHNIYCCDNKNNCEFINDSEKTCKSWKSICNNNTKMNWNNNYC